MAEGMPDLSGLVSGLLANPAALSSLASLLGGMRASEGGGTPPPPKEEGVREEHTAEGGEVPALPVFSELHGGGGGGPHGGRRQQRECLIRALVPYLSPERRRAAEGACKLLEVLELFEGRR